MRTRAITEAITTLAEAERQYDVSRVFAPFISHQELYRVLQVLKRMSQAIGIDSQ
ncbi:MAG TPA: hypothetical protein V6C85_29145 [Allocoleopsis sp.]